MGPRRRSEKTGDTGDAGDAGDAGDGGVRKVLLHKQEEEKKVIPQSPEESKLKGWDRQRTHMG